MEGNNTTAFWCCLVNSTVWASSQNEHDSVFSAIWIGFAALIFIADKFYRRSESSGA